MPASGSAASTVLTVFLSSPGDVRAEIDLADDVVRDLHACVQPLGIFLQSWRYERNAPPGVDQDAQSVLAPLIPDYDLYIGVMCKRLGTPTRTAASGTMEEFQDACRRRESTGRPAIFFYFCAEDLCCGHPQSEAVRGVRATYPGLFREFRDKSQFAALLKQDMLLWLTHTVLGKRSPARRPVNPPWLIHTHRSARMIARLREAVPVTEILSAQEEETLLAAAFRLATGSPHANWSTDLTAAAELATTACHEYLNGSQATSFTDERTSVLASLLAIADLLERERSGRFEDGQIPAAHAGLDDWVRFLTREIRVNNGGFVQYVLEAPDVECIDGLKRCTSLRLESLWQRLRVRLAPLRIAITVAPSEIVLAPPARHVPESVLRDLRTADQVALQHVPSLNHLGDEPPVNLDVLVPLIHTTVAGKLAIRIESARRHVLQLFKPGDAGTSMHAEASVPGWIELDVSALEVGAEYEWALFAYGAAGFPTLMRAGCVVIGGNDVRVLLDAISSSLPDQIRSVCRSLALHDELLREVWSDLGRTDTPSEDRLWAYERLLEGYEFSRTRYPQLAQVEAFRNAAGWLLSLQGSGEPQ